MFWNYIFWLILFSVMVWIFELLWPARKQKILREWLWSDYLHLAFNGHILGVILYGITSYRILPHLDTFLATQGYKDVLYFQAVSGWSIWVQAIVALIILDFVQWLVHNTLHRSNFLWEIHKIHHSVKDGEMDWIVSFRFSWIEPVIYKSVMYIPVMWFGFAPEALFFHAVFGTLIGHLNHANLTWDYGPLKYVFNSPRMHLYHHAYDSPANGQNFGITLSCWDWIFRTSHLPDEPCPKIGFRDVEKLPNDFFGQMLWPLPHFFSIFGEGTRVLTSILGLLVIGGLFGMSFQQRPETPMFNEPIASSQPTRPNQILQRPSSPEEFKQALEAFGSAAKDLGWEHPEYAVFPEELAIALGSPNLKILDVRAGSDYEERFINGHIPSAQLVTRSDYSGGDIPGLSFEKEKLQSILRSKDIQNGDTIVITGDGGPEPYRLWWTLLQVGGLNTRILDGGLAGWKDFGEALASGNRAAASNGNIILSGGKQENLMWSNIASLQQKYSDIQFMDTRSLEEYTGEELNKKSLRAGHIPTAKHVDWKKSLTLKDTEYSKEGVPVLKSPEEIKVLLQENDFEWDKPLITYCQSGTRSSAIYYALMQAGYQSDLLWNYDGSWAEYSRSDQPVELGNTHANVE